MAMIAGDDSSRPRAAPRRSLLRDPTVRSVALQVLLFAALALLAYVAATNVVANLQRASIASGFGFLEATANFDITQTLIPYSAASTYGRALLAGILNTLMVAAIGVVLATLLGFVVGVARLSKNVVVSTLAQIYVETLRNIPLLLQLLFWYNAVLKPLPGPRQSFDLGFGAFLNNRGLYIPKPVFGEGGWLIAAAAAAGLVAAFVLHRWATRRRRETGRPFPSLLAAPVIVLGLPLVAALVAGPWPHVETPELRGFNLVGGFQLLPEFVALVLGLVLYTAAFIAEIVRAGIASVAKGQTEAARALGLSATQTTRLVVIPQALRLIVPPLTSQYLNLTKNSSLAVAIGYPDLMQIGAGPVLQNTGQALEVIALIMVVYLIISLATSLIMNIYNRRVALVER